MQNLLDDMAGHLNAARFSTLVATYDFPFVLHLEDRMMVFPTPSDAIRALENFRGKFNAAGHLTSQWRLSALELPRHGRFRVWGRLLHRDQAGAQSGQSEAIFYFRDRRHWLCLEMMHVIKMAGPEFIAHPAKVGHQA